MRMHISQFGKQPDGNYTAQRVLIESTSVQQPTQVSAAGKFSSLLCPAVKEVLACVPRGLSPEKSLCDYPPSFRSPSNEDERDEDRALDDVSEA